MTGVLDILESVDNTSSVISYIGFDVSLTQVYMSFHADTVADTDPLKTILLSTISMFTRLTLNALILSGGRGLRPGWLRPGWL